MKTYAKLAGTSALALLASLAVPVAAFAAAGQAEPWQIGLQDAASPVSEYIHWFHNFLLVMITIITLFVLGLLIVVMVKFNAKANPVPSKTTHHVGLEVAWTVIPVLILVAIAIPSFRLLYLQRDIPQADMTLKIIGNPGWNWTYQYPDLGVDEQGEAKVSFTASLLPEDQAKADGKPYLLATDVPVVVPVNKTVKLIVTSDPAGIIHAWTIPSFGMKIDAIPGRLNEDWFKATQEGVFYGQCSELCGKDHAYMPIEVHVVSEADFAAWSEKVKTASIDEARDFLFALVKARSAKSGDQLASN
ncbi:MAG: cytochrome c oxidase subunit II [Phyllobacteriaceae bacterium]|jgi:cytochrome c oxidase subunit 2|nr:cytochrome c oxidase subunit II [Phyllobacteriaceae bacterium]